MQQFYASMTSSAKPKTTSRPRHVAVIMDGNGRWAEERGLPRLDGHRRGAEGVNSITTYSRELGIEYLTLYSFSVQNWQRPPQEVAGLMDLLEEYCAGEESTLQENDIKLRIVGRTDRLPPSTQAAVEGLVQRTAANRSMTLSLALDYGGREELVAAMRLLGQEVVSGRLSINAISERTISSRLNTGGMPDPDLMIRTSGEIRTSNFLVWQAAYAELYFCDKAWPDFGRSDFTMALQEYATRQRRFGRTGAQQRASVSPNDSDGATIHPLVSRK